MFLVRSKARQTAHPATAEANDELLTILGPTLFIGVQLGTSFAISIYAICKLMPSFQFEFSIWQTYHTASLLPADQNSLNVAIDETYDDDDDDKEDPDHNFGDSTNRSIGRFCRSIWIACCLVNGKNEWVEARSTLPSYLLASSHIHYFIIEVRSL